MNKTTILATILFSSFTLYQCTGPKIILTSPADKELAAAQKRWPDATKESLAEGHTIYTTKCTKCHADKGITSRSEAEWGRAIAEMAPKANLTDGEKETLTRYVYTVRELNAVKR